MQEHSDSNIYYTPIHIIDTQAQRIPRYFPSLSGVRLGKKLNYIKCVHPTPEHTFRRT